MNKSDNHWENNVSEEKKRRIAAALGTAIDRQLEMESKLAELGRESRIDEAKRKCAEKRAKRDALQSLSNASLSHGDESATPQAR